MTSHAPSRRWDLFAEEEELLAWLRQRAREEEPVCLSAAQVTLICEAHQRVVKTLARITKVSDIAQRQLALSRRDLRSEVHGLQRSNSALVDRDAEKNDILALAAHDLRSPMATILGLTDAIEGCLPASTDGEIREYLEDIRHLAGDAGEFVSRLLNAYRLTRDQAQPGLLDLQAFSAQFATTWRATASLRQIGLRVICSGAAAPVRLDAGLLRRVLDNIVSNAIKYSPAGGTVEIAFSWADGRLALEIRDEGEGISASDRAKLFTHFTRSEPAPAGEEPSEGMGLALIHRVLQMMGGSIAYRPRDPRGSIFDVALPCPLAD